MKTAIQQTAVNWYIEQVFELDIKYHSGLVSISHYPILKSQIAKKAKELEKQQIEDAFDNGIETCANTDSVTIDLYRGGKFYEETYEQ